MKTCVPQSKGGIALACLLAFMVSFYLVYDKEQQRGIIPPSEVIPVETTNPTEPKEIYRARHVPNPHLNCLPEPSIMASITDAISEISESIQNTICHESDCNHLKEARDNLELEYLKRKTFEARLHPRILDQSIQDLQQYHNGDGNIYRGFLYAMKLRQYQKSVMEDDIFFPSVDEYEPLAVLITDDFQFVFYDGYALQPGSHFRKGLEVLAINEESMDLEDVETGEINTIEFRYPYLKMMMVGQRGIPTDGLQFEPEDIDLSNWGKGIGDKTSDPE